MAQGVKTGGRQKGSQNKASVQKAKAVAASGETPLDYMLRVMRDTGAEYARRDEMAKASAPYIHPKLTAIQHSGDAAKPVMINVSWKSPVKESSDDPKAS
jgi:hypothetical protein